MQAADDLNNDYLTPSGHLSPVPNTTTLEPGEEWKSEEITEEDDEAKFEGGTSEQTATGQYEEVGGAHHGTLDIDPTNLDENLAKIKNPMLRKLVRERVDGIGSINKKMGSLQSQKIVMQAEIEELLGIAVSLGRAEQATLFGEEQAALDAVAAQEAEASDQTEQQPPSNVTALEQAAARREARKNNKKA